MPLKPHAVLFGKDEILNLTRRLILERAGFIVLTARTLPEVETLLREHAVDLLALCYGTTEQDCLRIITCTESGRNAPISKLWLGHIGARRPAYLPHDVFVTSGDPHQLFVAARQSLTQIQPAAEEIH